MTQCGTPLYMPPEIIKNEEYDTKVDIWSVGCLVFEMMSGKMPFSGSSKEEAFTNICQAPLELPEGVPFSASIVRLLRKVNIICMNRFEKSLLLHLFSIY